MIDFRSSDLAHRPTRFDPCCTVRTNGNEHSLAHSFSCSSFVPIVDPAVVCNDSHPWKRTPPMACRIRVRFAQQTTSMPMSTRPPLNLRSINPRRRRKSLPSYPSVTAGHDRAQVVETRPPHRPFSHEKARVGSRKPALTSTNERERSRIASPNSSV